MIRQGHSGGMLHISSFLREEDRLEARESGLRLASASLREAAKIGLQSLYADADKVLEKYKDFDIIKEMKERKGKFLWVRARSIDADVCNANGDYFAEDELLADVEDQQGKTMPAYKTFESVPIYTNHKNDDITQAKGMVVYAEWDDKEKCVWCTFIVDEEAYPDIARGIRTGILHDVSMGCFDGSVRIPTNSGYKCIVDVEDSDLLLDADGEFVRIVNRQEYDHSETIHVITLEGGFQIKCTDYHPFLSFTKSQWSGRKSLKRPVIDGRKSSAWVTNEIEPEYTRTDSLSVGDVLLSPIGGSVRQDPDFTPGRARLAGLFLAEGTYVSNGRKRVIFCLNINERDTIAEEILALLKSELGVQGTARTNAKNNSCTVSVCGAKAYDWFLENCGRYSKEKMLAPKWLTAPLSIQAHLYGGYFDGDGSVTHDKRSDHDYLRSSTISRGLHEQLSFILTRMGVHHSAYFNYRGRHFTYLEAMAEDEVSLSHVIQIPSSYSHFLTGKTTKNFTASTLFEGQHTYKNWLGRKIISIEALPISTQKVYTFQTETGNYIAMNFISKNCQVESGTCSQCGNKATVERDYCQCLKKHKGKKDPKSGKKVYEKNHGLKFIELSIVGDGAFDSCSVEEIYDVDDILRKASDLQKRAEGIHGSIMVAASMLPPEAEQRNAYEDALRSVASTTQSAVRLAQTAGTLVGGQLMAGEGADQNTTVANILQFLGIDARGGLNIMDMLNLALNFLEVAVMNLFARKDNVDLAHVAKITKSMGDLQATMQDMIDDGVDTSGGAQGTPLNQGAQGGAQPQQPGQQAPGATPGAPGAPPTQQQANYIQHSVGRGVYPMSFDGGGMGAPGATSVQGIGGGPLASSGKGRMIVWAGSGEQARSVTASVGSSRAKHESGERSLLRLGEGLCSLKQAVDAPDAASSESGKARTSAATGAATRINSKVQAGHTSQAGQSNGSDPKNRATGESIMEIFKRFVQERRRKQAARASLDFKVEDESGYRVILSSDGSISAYDGGKRLKWEPNLTEAQLNSLDGDGGYEVAGDLLDGFREAVAAAAKNGTRLASWTPEGDDDVKEHLLEQKRTGTDDDVKEHLLEKGAPGQELSKRRGTDDEVRELTLDGGISKRRDSEDDVKEHLLGDAAGHDKRREGTDFPGMEDVVKEELIKDARHGYPDEVIELQLQRVRDTYAPGDPNLTVKSAMNAALAAMGSAVIAAKVTPDEILEAAAKLAKRDDLADMVKIASLGTKHRQAVAARRAFHKIASAEMAAETAVLDALGSSVCDAVAAADLAEAVVVASTEHAKSVKSVTRLAQAQMGEGLDLEPAAVRKTVSRADLMRAALATASDASEENLLAKDHLKAALHAMAMAASSVSAHPKEVVAAVADSDADTLISQVEVARTASAIEARMTARARAEFYGTTRVAGRGDVHESLVGWLADYADAGELSSVSIVEAAKHAARYTKTAESHIAKTIKTISSREAGTITEEKTTSKRINCTLSDLGGIDPKSEDFENSFRSKAMEIMASAGYSVDPSTFALTELTVNGESVTASITTRLSKTFDVNASSSSMGGGDMGGAAQDGSVQGDTGMGGGMPPQGPEAPIEAGDTIATAGAHRLRTALRKEMLARYAQAAPGGAAPGMGGGADPLGGTGGVDGAAAGPGMSALTTPPDAGAEGDEPADTDSMSEPGKIQPPGTVCPGCGSKDVDVANGAGTCKSCGSQIEFEILSKLKPGDAKDAGGDDAGAEPDAAGAEAPPLGADAGLGAATAPAPAPAGGAAQPMMMQASWDADSDTFIRLAMPDFDRSSEATLPVGYICPSCGNREASKHNDRTYCYSCGTLAVSEIRESSTAGKVRASIRWVI
jgi:hypothetical protein